MAKTKVCSFCKEETTRLFYANPKCCTKGSCLMKYKNQKHEKKESKAGDGAGTSKPGQSSGKIRNKSKRIKPISDKQAKKLKEYREVRDKYLKEHPNCEICGKTPVELHHKKPRAYYLTDVSIFMSVCRACHSKIESHDAWARENGYKLNHL